MITFSPNQIIKSADLNANFSELKDKTDILTTPTTWAGVTYANSWVDYDSNNWYGVQYYKDALNIVHLRGLTKSGTTTSGTTMFTLPVGCRPARACLFVVISNGAIGRVDLGTDGAMKTNGVGNSYVSFNNIHFLAEQ